MDSYAVLRVKFSPFIAMDWTNFDAHTSDSDSCAPSRWTISSDAIHYNNHSPHDQHNLTAGLFAIFLLSIAHTTLLSQRLTPFISLKI